MRAFGGAAHALLRIVSGLLFSCHGGMKLMGWFGGLPPGTPMTPMILTSGWIELVGGALILIGLLTRGVAFIACGEMAVAYFTAHFPHGFWPIQNHGETAVLNCFIFLFLFSNGPGPLSLDTVIWRARRAPVPAPAT